MRSDERPSIGNPSLERTSALRAIDANANRCLEGLRVVEDHGRFFLNDSYITARCKQLRHNLADLLRAIPTADLQAARDTANDVGTQISTESEGRRDHSAGIAAANWKRVQQSLRCLEEYGKYVAPELAASLERMRYESYVLDRVMTLTQQSAARLADVRLYLLVDGRADMAKFAQLVRTVLPAGVDMVQLRDKQLDDRSLLERARFLRQLTVEHHCLLIINDRPDLARLSGADGVHLGQEDLSVAEARQIVGPRPLIGVSTHDLNQARQAVLDGANYIGCGPTFPSPTKDFTLFPGIPYLRSVAEEIGLPAFAIGGIDVDNVGSVTAAGFTRAAVSAAIHGSADPVSVIKRLRETLESVP